MNRPNDHKRLLTILGPTACGKTRFAVMIAKALDGEIISADSRQVFRGMTIGTGKDLKEYQGVPYHLIDIAEAGERYSVYQFQHDFHEAYEDIISRGKQPILCGGTGLYIESVLKNYEFDGREMPPVDGVIVGLHIDRDERREKISRRLRERLDEGMVEEVQALLDKGVSAERLIRYGLEYKYLTLYLTGKLQYDEMVERLEIAIHQFAKRQMTWFRGMEERRGENINWIDIHLPAEEQINAVKALLLG